jgi:hypothetical protein
MFTICHILNQVHKQPKYLILKQQHQKVQNKQQQEQIRNQYSLQPSTITATAIITTATEVLLHIPFVVSLFAIPTCKEIGIS